MTNTRTLGEIIASVTAGHFVKIKGVGYLVTQNKAKPGRKPGRPPKEKK